MTPEALSALEGTEVAVSRWFALDQARIDGFADVTEDHQFIHVDTEADTPFGGTIAHGFLTLSMLSAMSYDVFPRVDGATMGVNYGFNRLRFLSPVKSGRRVRGRFALASCDLSVPGQMTNTWQVTVETEGEETPALVAEWINRWYITQTKEPADA